VIERVHVQCVNCERTISADDYPTMDRDIILYVTADKNPLKGILQKRYHIRCPYCRHEATYEVTSPLEV